MSIEEILKNGANITLAVGVDDLKEFHSIIMNDAKQEAEKKLKQQETIETLYDRDQVSNILNVDKVTLWRWSKRNYLKPIRIGGLVRYRKSDIDYIIESKNK